VCVCVCVCARDTSCKQTHATAKYNRCGRFPKKQPYIIGSINNSPRSQQLADHLHMSIHTRMVQGSPAVL
jgi:hypothetical protein